MKDLYSPRGNPHLQGVPLTLPGLLSPPMEKACVNLHSTRNSALSAGLFLVTPPNGLSSPNTFCLWLKEVFKSDGFRHFDRLLRVPGSLPCIHGKQVLTFNLFFSCVAVSC